MASNDVPGANPANNDELAVGAWGEHEDGSLIFVEGVQDYRVIYSMFDMAPTPPLEYRDAMSEIVFKRSFSWSAPSASPLSNEKWTWHDKTPFPWNKIIKEGISDGARLTSAADTLSAAARIAASLGVRAEEFDRQHFAAYETRERVGGIMARIGRALKELRR